MSKSDGRFKKQREDIDRGVLAIDRSKLDEEWENQAEVVFDYGEKQAEARADLAEEEDAFEAIKAELDKAIRDNPESYGCSKVTEPAIRLCIANQAEYQTAKDRLRRAKFRVDMLTAMLIALDHKKKALEHMVILHGQQYFASPRSRNQEDREHMDDVRHNRKREENRKLSRKVR